MLSCTCIISRGLLIICFDCTCVHSVWAMPLDTENKIGLYRRMLMVRSEAYHHIKANNKHPCVDGWELLITLNILYEEPGCQAHLMHCCCQTFGEMFSRSDATLCGQWGSRDMWWMLWHFFPSVHSFRSLMYSNLCGYTPACMCVVTLDSWSEKYKPVIVLTLALVSMKLLTILMPPCKTAPQ